MRTIVSKITQYSSSFFQRSKIAIDIGTAVTRICIEGKGIVLREPTFIGMDTKNGEVLFFGQEAKDIFGKSPDFIHVITPFESSIISDFDATVSLMKYFLGKSVHPYYKNTLVRFGIEGVSTVPTTSTEVEQKALQESLIKAGFSKVHLVEKPIASAYGAGLPIFSNQPSFVIDLGAGVVEMAVIIMGGIVESRVLKLGGNHMDKLIHNYLHLKYGLVIGDQTAEMLKNKLFSLETSKDVVTVRGKSLENGLPKTIRVTSADVREALSVVVNQIVDGIKDLIETTPPEIIDGLMKNGAFLTGHIAHTPGLSKYISNDIKIPVEKADTPEDATVRGLAKLIKEKDTFERVMIA